MTPPVPAAIATGFNVTAGCAYWRAHDQLLLVDSGTGTISAVTVHTHAKTVLGTGYIYLQDIALSADGLHAYVVESTGNLLRVPLSNLNRAAATVVASSLGSGKAGQIGLDEAHGYAYVAGGTATTNLLRINLATGATSTAASGLGNTRGVLASRDGRFVYVSDDSGRIVRYDVAAGTNRVVASGLNGPRFMTWSDAGESVIVFVQHGPPAMVMKLDLTTLAPSVVALTGPTDPDPYSVAVPAPDHVLVACHRAVDEVYLASAIYSAAGPMLLGIGFVPADAAHLPGGYADTTMDPSYFFQVKDAPFGGTLPLMINHDRARSLGAHFYKVEIGPPGSTPVEVHQAYSDYRWNAVLNRFDLVTQVPVNGFYPVHAAGEIWLNYWLGMLLDTGGQPNGLNKISIRLFGSQSAASEIGTAAEAGRSATLMIDNTLPVVHIDQILHDGSPVAPCQIVNSGSHNFSFTITAQAQRHLAAWSLVAYWGDNASKAVASDDYSHHISPSHLWTGVDHVTVPPAPWDASVASDPTSTRCAHTFWLSAWDRVINGWGRVHDGVSYQKSITIWL
jgi:hypothetical protein